MVPECRHIKTSGGKCGSPALRDKPYCYFHTRLRERAARPPSPYLAIDLPTTLEDRGSIQLALSEIVCAIADNRLDNRRAGMLLYALQIASSNAKYQEEIVSTNSVEETVLTEKGDEIAAEGAKNVQEETLADLLTKGLRNEAEWRRNFCLEHRLHVDEYGNFSQKPWGEGDEDEDEDFKEQLPLPAPFAFPEPGF